jgi:phage baseplate assembly protein V
MGSMITLLDFSRLIRPIRNKIFLIIGRAILTAVQNSEQTQKVQVQALHNETLSDVERVQEYGFESYPKPGSAEAVLAAVGGNREQSIVIVVGDRAYRPTDLAEGEVAVYSLSGNVITMKQDGEVHILYDGGALEYAPLASKIKTIVDNEVIAKYNAHKHTGVTAGGATSGPSDTPMVAPALADYQSEGVKIS